MQRRNQKKTLVDGRERARKKRSENALYFD